MRAHLVAAALIGIAAHAGAQSPPALGDGGAGVDANLLSAEAEASAARLVREAIASGEPTARVLAGRRLVTLAYTDAAQRALRRNLSLQLQRQVSAEASAIELRAQSLFDPVATVATNYTRSNSWDRSAMITRVRRQSPDFDQLQQQFLQEQQNGTAGTTGQPVAACTVIVDGVPVIDGAAAGRPECQPTVTTQEEFASFRGLRPNQSLALSIANSKLFQYGGSLSLALSTTYNPRQTPFVSVSSTDVAYIDRRWTYASNLSLSLATPLPFARNFGADGNPAASELQLARMRLVRAEYEYDAAANAVLLAVDNAFSDLVASLMTVQVTLAQKSILADIRARTRRGYELGEVNQYSLDQVEARYAATLTQEALAWNGFVSASEALSNLLYGDVFELILPAAYAEYLARATHVDLGKAMQAALERNATVKRAEILVEESRIALNHRLADTRPDLLLSAGLSFGQNAQVVGYEDLGSSLRNVFNPDVRTVSVALTFRLPIGNTAVKAALSAARIDLLQARDQLTQARSLVVQNLSTSADALQSAQKQVEVARINTGLAEEAFAAANRRRAQNLATEFERLEVENDLLSARLGYVDALVQYRKNVAQFLASQNLLLETVQ